MLVMIHSIGIVSFEQNPSIWLFKFIENQEIGVIYFNGAVPSFD